MLSPQATVEKFKRSLHGEIFVPRDTSDETARQVWHGLIDRRPALIASRVDVAELIRSGAKRCGILYPPVVFCSQARCC
jgi:hypothetical protein